MPSLITGLLSSVLPSVHYLFILNFPSELQKPIYNGNWQKNVYNDLDKNSNKMKKFGSYWTLDGHF